MHKEKKVKPGTFIRKMHKSLQARYTEHIIKHELPQKPEAPLNLDQSQETWKKEECFPSTKFKFFSVPHKIPAPQKRRSRRMWKWKLQVLMHVSLLQRTPCR